MTEVMRRVSRAIGLLLAYQLLMLNDLSPVIVWEKSRRIGASFALALKAVLLAAKKRDQGGMNVFYLSYNKDMTKQFIRDADFWAKKIGLAAGEFKEEVIRDDLRQLKVINGTPKLEAARRQTETGQRHGDAAIALALAHFAKRKGLAADPWRAVFPEASQSQRLLSEYGDL